MAFGLKLRYAWVVVFFLTSYQLLVHRLLWRILVYTFGEKQLNNSMSNRAYETKFCMDCSFLDLLLFNHESRNGNLDQFSLTSFPVSPCLRNITNLWSSVLPSKLETMKLSTRTEKDRKATNAARNAQEERRENKHWLAGTENYTFAVLVLDWAMSLEKWQSTQCAFT